MVCIAKTNHVFVYLHHFFVDFLLTNQADGKKSTKSQRDSLLYRFAINRSKSSPEPGEPCIFS
jgi:hypothetical protein